MASQNIAVTKYVSVALLLEQNSYESFSVISWAAGVIRGLSTPKVLFTHNVEATIWRRHY